VNQRLALRIGMLLVLAAATRWLLVSLADDDDAPRLPSARSDYTLEDFDLQVMNDAGQPSFRVISPFLEKSPDDGSVTVDTPVVFLYDRGAENWRIDSASGWIRADGEELERRGDVVLDRRQPEALTIRTPSLWIYPELEQARSQQAVRIERPGVTLEGVGMNAWLGSQRIELLSEVKGHYEPPPT